MHSVFFLSLSFVSSFKLDGDSCLKRAKKGQFMSATRLGIVSSTAKILFLLDYLTSKVITCSYIILPSAGDPFLIRPAPAEPSVVILWYFLLLEVRYGRQVDYEHAIRVLIVW